MATDEEKRAFGIHKKYRVSPNVSPKKKTENGKLLYKNETIYRGPFPLCQKEKQRLIQQGYNKEYFKITYDT